MKIWSNLINQFVTISGKKYIYIVLLSVSFKPKEYFFHQFFKRIIFKIWKYFFFLIINSTFGFSEK